MISKQVWYDLIRSPITLENVKTVYVNNEWLNRLIDMIVRGSYATFFNENPQLQNFNEKTIDDPEYIQIAQKLDEDRELVGLLRMLIGIAYLQLFTINNFTGPKISINNSEQNQPATNVIESLTCDGVAPVSTGECFLYLAKTLEAFEPGKDDTQHNWAYYWWMMRATFIHQKMLEEHSITLFDRFQTCYEKIRLNLSEIDKTHKILYLIEVSYIFQYYYDWRRAEEMIAQAKELSGLDINLSGQLGKRTRYQVKNTSQLIVGIARKDNQNTFSPSENIEEKPRILPKDLSLNDDVVLNEIQFENGNVYHDLTIQLNVIEQLVLLLVINDRQVNNPKHEITIEEQLAFLTYILARPINWSIQTCSLILRCKNETENRRKIERTLLQLQELIDQFDHENPSSSMRLEYFHSTAYDPMWKLKTHVANTYLKLGLINNALDFYLYLKKWNDVITCYQLMKKLSQAEYVIREQLQIKETPDLLCSLGEVTNEIEHFQRAWELSKGRSGRAQRLMGKYYFNRGNYEKACEHLIKAVEINSLQHDLWFWLGSAAFRTEKWELGIQAYSRCTNIESDNFEAWNNLAACHTKLKQIDKAHKVFLEAIKCNYDNWKVWENFLWTSADCGEIDDVIQAYHRLIDLKTKYVDKHVLHRLVRLLSESEHNEVWKKFYQKSLELFGRVTAQVTNEADVWEFYSDLCQLNNDDKSIECDSKVLQLLQKAHRCAISQASAWESKVETIQYVVHLSNKVLTTTIEKLGEHGNDESFKTICHSIRMAVKTVISRLKQKYDNSSITDDKIMSENVQQLETSLTQLNDMLLRA